MRKCPCGSRNVGVIGHYTIMVAMDDEVDVLQIMCFDCEREWED